MSLHTLGSPRYAPWEGWPACPCNCGATGLKLQTRHDRHLVGCVCRVCMGRRNRKKGQRAEAMAHRKLGGTGQTIRDDLFHAYPIELSLETKTGDQLPAKFLTFARGKWAKDAWRQAEKKTPVGEQASPAIYLLVSPSEAYVVVNVSGKKL